MKLFLLIFMLPFTGSAQSYVSLIDPDSTSVWKDYDEHVHVPNQGWIKKWESVYTISGDTVLNGESYAALSSSIREDAQPIPNVGSGIGFVNYYNYDFFGAIREEGKQIFFWDKNGASEHLIYDFNLGLGDTIPTPSPSYQAPSGIIESIDSIQINSSYRKRYHIVDFNGTPADTDSIFLIEGIGSTSGFLPYDGFIFQVFEGRNWLSCYKEYGSVLYSNNYPTPTECITEGLSVEESDAANLPFEIYPNPVRAGSTISIDYQHSNAIEVNIVDVRSQLVKTVLLDKKHNILEISFPAGLYFLSTDEGSTFQRFVVY